MRVLVVLSCVDTSQSYLQPTNGELSVVSPARLGTADALIADFGVEQLEPLVVTGDDPRSLRYDELDDRDIARVATACWVKYGTVQFDAAAVIHRRDGGLAAFRIRIVPKQ